MKRIIVVIVISLQAVFLLASNAGAHTVFVEDWNDSPSVLDIHWAGLGHEGKFVFGAIRTMRSVRTTELGFEGDLYVDFDTRGDSDADYYVWLNKADGGYRGTLHKYTNNSSVYVAQASVWRYDDRTFNFAVKRRALNMSGGYIRWAANSRYFKGREYGEIIYNWDWAPDRGMRTHRF